MADRNLVLQLLITAKDQASGIVSGFVSSAKTQFAALTATIASAFSFKEAANFEKALDAIRARADETGPALEALISRAKTAAQTLGPEFGFSATAAAGGIKELIAAGFSADDAIKALKGTLALAAMEEISVAKAAVLISDAIVQFGLKAADAEKVSNILAKSAGAVAATATEMAEALKYTGNEASRSGMSLTKTAATLDVLASAGQRGSEAGTGLGSVLAILNNPAHAATKALFDLGATSTDLSDVLDFVQQRGLRASEVIALFGEQGGRVINTLISQGGSKAIEKFGNDINSAGKSAEETAKIMQGNFLGALDRFWESLKRVGVELATPKLEPFAKGLDTATAALNKFASNEQIQAFQLALANGFSAAYEKVKAFSADIDWSGIKTSASGTFVAIANAVDKALNSLGSIYSSLTGTLPGAANIGRQAGELFKAAWNGIGQLASGIASGIEQVAQALGGSVAPNANRAQTALDGVTQSTQKQATGFQTLWQALKTDALQGLKSTWDSLARGAGDLLAAINNLGQKGSEILAGLIRGADFGPLRDLFNAVADAAKRLTGTVTGEFPNAERAATVFASSFTVGWSGIVGILSAVVAGTLKVVEAIGRATFEVGKYFNRYSDEEIARIEANLNSLSISAGEFANVAARSFEASGQAMDRMRAGASSAAQQQQLLADAAGKTAQAQVKLAEETAKQAASQGDAVAKTQALAEAITLQQAEVSRLAATDQTAKGAKDAHAAATAKLNGMQGDFIETVKTLTGAQYSSAIANDKVRATVEKLDKAQAASREEEKKRIPTLTELRQNMERTRQAWIDIEEAQRKGILTEKEGKSVTEQVNAAKKKAVDAQTAYNQALESGVERAKRHTSAIEAVANAQMDGIRAERDMASALGANALVEQKSVELKKAEAAWAKILTAAKQAEIAAERTLLQAKSAQLQADGLKTEQNKADYAALQLQNAALGLQSEALQKSADAKDKVAKTAGLTTKATEGETQATDQNTGVQEKNTDAKKKGGSVAKEMADALAYAREQTKALSEATGVLFEKLYNKRSGAEGIADTGLQKYIIALDQVPPKFAAATQKISEMNAAVAEGERQYLYASNSVGRFLANLQISSAQAKKAWYEQKLQADILTDSLQNLGASGSQNMALIAQATRAAGGDLALLDEEDLSGLRSALDEAKQKLQALQDEAISAKDRIAELDAELAKEQGNDDAYEKQKLQLEQAQALREAENALAKARAEGNRDLITLYETQIQKLNTLYDLKERNLEQSQREKKEQAEAEARKTATGGSSANASGETITTTTSSSGGGSGLSGGNTYSPVFSFPNVITADRNAIEDLTRRHILPVLKDIERRTR